MLQSLKKYWVRKDFSGNVFVKTNKYYKSRDRKKLGKLEKSWNLIWKSVDAYSVDEAKNIGLATLPKTEFFNDLSPNQQIDIVKNHTNYISIEKGYLICKIYRIYKQRSIGPSTYSCSPCSDKLTIYVINHPKAIYKYNKIKNMREACE